MKSFLILPIFIIALFSCSKESVQDSFSSPVELSENGKYIVILKDNNKAEAHFDSYEAYIKASKEESEKYESSFLSSKKSTAAIQVEHVYMTLFHGFSAQLSPTQLEELRNNPLVEEILVDAKAIIDEPQAGSSYSALKGGNGNVPWNIKLMGGPIEVRGKRVFVLDDGIDLALSPYLNLDMTNCANFNDGKINKDVQDQGGYHGTKMACLIGAKPFKGICGFAQGMKIVPIKFWNNNDGYFRDFIAAVDYICGISKPGDIINCSISFDSKIISQKAEKDLVKQLEKKNISMVCAAGNYAKNVKGCFPQRIDYSDHLVSVGCFNQKYVYSPFCNYGSSVEFMAPGEDVAVICPGGSVELQSGSSFAAPLVSALLSSGREVDLLRKIYCPKDRNSYDFCVLDLDN